MQKILQAGLLPTLITIIAQQHTQVLRYLFHGAKVLANQFGCAMMIQANGVDAMGHGPDCLASANVGAEDEVDYVEEEQVDPLA